MKYAVLFLILGPALVAEAVVGRGLYWLLLWPGISLTVVGLAYLRLGPGVFGKKPDGTLAWYSVLLLLPYLLAAWVVWQVARIVGREDCCNEAAPGLFVGRRPLAGELPSQVTLVVDLAAEFIECRAVRTACRYISAPVLDTGV
ncbi:MAG: phosphatase, partial [Pirellulaceae bacterium]|nr:phosphatase [Pirellulaceae bacterium]